MKKQIPGWAVLLIITLVAGLALGGTFSLTKDSIDNQAVLAAENARKAALPMADTFVEMDLNVRSASAKGFAGPVYVELTLDDEGKIADMKIGNDAFAETPGFGAKALEESFAAQFIGKTAPVAANDIDVIAGATITTNAVLDAVNAAASATPAVDWCYAGYSKTRSASAQGFAGPVYVELTLDDEGKIASMKIGNDAFAETPGFGAKALEESFAAQFVGKTAPVAANDIDAIAGATVTTNAVLDAVNAAANAPAGYVAQITVQGFGGPVEVIAGLDSELNITGISVGGSNFSETAGLGAKAKDAAFTDQFIGKPAPVKVIKAGGTPADNTVDAITAATITSNAVAGAVNQIAKHVEGILFPEGRGEEIVLPEKPESGVVGASAKGYAGPVWVDAAFDAEGKIIYISVGNDEFNETPTIGGMAKEPDFLIQFIGKQAPVSMSDIDALSGATITSKAVVEALNKAYEAAPAGGAAPAAPAADPAPAAPAETAAPALPEKPAEGVYGASAQGFAGPVWVDVAFDAEGKITFISVGNDQFAETPGFGLKAKDAEYLLQFIGKTAPLAETDVDAISGATITSKAVISAVNAAYDLSQGGTEEAAAPVADEAPATEEAAAAEYIGVGKGFGGEIKVKVTMDGDKIAKIEILEQNETAGLADKSLKEIPNAIIANQSTDFTIDAATMGTTSLTNNGIIEAVNNALEQIAPVAEEAVIEESAAAEYIGVGNGFGGEIKVKVTMDGDKIAKIEILEQNETAGLADKSLKEIPNAIIANQSTDFTIDAATMGTTSLTNNGIIEAVNNALEQIAPAAEEAVAEEAAVEEAAAAEYIGVGKGFGGEIKVKVTMDGDKIAKIEILEQNETAGLADKSLKEIPNAIIANQSTDFTIDAATMGTTSLTNNGIIEAVNNALEQIAPAAEEAVAEEAAVEEAAAAEYIGVGKGFGGEIKVKVTMDGDKIAKIEILEQNETAGLADKSLKEIPNAIIANQSTDFTIDAATMGTTSLTNNGIIEAVNNALNQAGGQNN